ncbi:MAG: mechanosensitive ion channel family protein [Psychrobacter sp.]|nr:mechanosensitive ion channel family protein [Psychrobacter sp.]
MAASITVGLGTGRESTTYKGVASKQLNKLSQDKTAAAKPKPVARFYQGLLVAALGLTGMGVILPSSQAAEPVGPQTDVSSAPSDSKVGAKEAAKAPREPKDKPKDLGEYVEQKVEEAQQNTNRGNDEISGRSTGIGAEITSAALGQNNREQTQGLQANSDLVGEYNEAYYPLQRLNAGLPKLAKPANLMTPMATLEFFQTAMMQKKFALASYALNLNLLDERVQSTYAIELAKKLDFLLSEQKLYVFDELSDRPDGLIEPPIGSNSNILGVPRRSIKLGYIKYDARRVPISLERVRVGQQPPVWVFSAQTVDNIEMLYDQHKPAEFTKYLPDWLTARFFGIAIWEYLTLLLFFSITMGIGWVFSRFTGIIIRWYSDGKEVENPQHTKTDGLPDFINKLLVPLTFTFSCALVFALVSGAFPYIDAVASSTRPIVWIALVIVTLWLGIRIINFFANRYQDLQIENLDDEHFHKARQRRTYVSIFRRLFIFIMLLGGFWIGLSEFANIEGLGKTLLTSAGIAGAVIGIAAQPILGNIIAGMLVAITQPVRIGDTVMMDGVWCTIEDLRYTYAVLVTWDTRRLIVPMRYFVTEVIENWSHTDAHQASAVYLYVDYGADIEAIRAKFIEVVKSHELWDEETEPNLLVSEVTESRIKLRGKVAATNPKDAWALECGVRETMLDYLNQDQRAHLPTERITLTAT